MPDTVLRQLAASRPGLQAAIEPGHRGHLLHRLRTAEGHKLLTVIEPPEGWPVRVIHHHVDPTHETEYVACGEGHDPNRPRHAADNPDLKLTRADWKELEHQAQYHSRIDGPDKLAALCAQLLAHPQTAGVLQRSARLAALAAAQRKAALRAAAAPAAISDQSSVTSDQVVEGPAKAPASDQ